MVQGRGNAVMLILALPNNNSLLDLSFGLKKPDDVASSFPINENTLYLTDVFGPVLISKP